MALKKSQFFLRLLIAQSLLLALGAGCFFLLPSAESPPIGALENRKGFLSPEQAVTAYFLTINNGIRQHNLDPAWQLMSAKFQRSDAGGDYTQFKTWWQKLQYVEIQQITGLTIEPLSPQVEALVVYHFKDGRMCRDHVRFSLIQNAPNHLWLIDGRKRLLVNGKFVCPPS